MTSFFLPRVIRCGWNFADWCRMTCRLPTAVIRSKSKPDVEFQYGVRLGEFSGMSSQSHLPHNSIRHIENRFSPVFLSFFRFLMQFGLWRATPFVSSPIYLLTKPRLLPHCYGPQCINNVLIGYDIATRHFALHCRHELQYQSLYDAEYVISNLSKIKVKVKVKVSVFI